MKNCIFKSVPLIAGAMISVAGSVSSASAYTVYTKNTFTNWQNAVSGSITKFEDFSNPNFTGRATELTFSTGIVSTGYGGTTDNIIFTSQPWAVSVAGDLGIDGKLYQGWVENPLLGSASRPTDYYNSIVWRFPQAVQGFFGTFLDTANGPGLLLTLNYDDNTSDTIDFKTLVALVNANSTRPRDKSAGDIIFGITSTKTFTSMTFAARPTGYDEGWLMDRFYFALANPTTNSISVPEPLTFLATTTALAFGIQFKRTHSKKD